MKRLLFLALLGGVAGQLNAAQKEHDYNRLIRTDVGRNLTVEQMIQKIRETSEKIPFLLDEEREQALSTLFSYCKAAITRHEGTPETAQKLRAIINLSDLSGSEKKFAHSLIQKITHEKQVEREIQQEKEKKAKRVEQMLQHQQDNLNQLETVYSEYTAQDPIGGRSFAKEKLLGAIIANLSHVIELDSSHVINQRIINMVNTSNLSEEEKEKIFNALTKKRAEILKEKINNDRTQNKIRAHQLHLENQEKKTTFFNQHGQKLMKDANITEKELKSMVSKLLIEYPEITLERLLRGVEELLGL